MKYLVNNVRHDRDRIFALEFQLALACARWPQEDIDRAEIRRLANETLDWEWFLRIIERNQIAPLTYHNLHEALPDERRSGLLGALRGRALANAGLSMSQAGELVRVCESLRRVGLDTVALKGVALSASVYGSITMRSCGDIDLLVSEAHVFDVERILADLGYIRSEPAAHLTPRRLKHYFKYHKHFTYFSEARASQLELHWRLVDSPLLCEKDTPIPQTTPVALGCGVVSTLSRNEVFLYLCVHGAIHGWPILKWLADIRAMLTIMTADDLAQIAELASKRGLMAELCAALILVDLFLKVEPPTAELPDEPNPATERIVEMAKRLLTAKDYCLEIRRPPRLAMFLYDLQLRSSWRYGSEGIRRALFFPADWYWIDLPDALFPLYAVVRPVSWLFRHLPFGSATRNKRDSSSVNTYS